MTPVSSVCTRAFHRLTFDLDNPFQICVNLMLTIFKHQFFFAFSWLERLQSEQLGQLLPACQMEEFRPTTYHQERRSWRQVLHRKVRMVKCKIDKRHLRYFLVSLSFSENWPAARSTQSCRCHCSEKYRMSVFDASCIPRATWVCAL